MDRSAISIQGQRLNGEPGERGYLQKQAGVELHVVAGQPGHIGQGRDGMSKFSRDLVQGMKEAAEFAEGKKAAAGVHVVEVPDVRAIRQLRLQVVGNS